jgi:hypothetical protein
MKPTMHRSTLAAAIGIAAAGLLLAADAPTAPAAKTPWKITGQLEEACTCSAACPCWFGSKPTKMTCGGGQVLFIEKGTYGSVPLDGLAVANMAQSPAGQGMMESFGKWTYSYLYIDEKAKPEQKEALTAVAKQVLPWAASENHEIRTAPITRTIAGKEHSISLGSYGSFTGHLVEGGLGGAVRIVNPPGADPLHHEYRQGTTTKLAYNDADKSLEAEGSNYMFGTFTLDSAQYEKFAAGLAQKMKEMQAKP